MRLLLVVVLLCNFFSLIGQVDTTKLKRKNFEIENIKIKNKYLLLFDIVKDLNRGESSLDLNLEKISQSVLEDSINSKLVNLKNSTSFSFIKTDTISIDNYLYFFAKINLDSADLRIFWDKENISFGSNTIHGIRKKILTETGKQLIFATNGGMYRHDFSPQGLLIKECKLISKLDTQKNLYGNFYIEPNGVFIIDTDNKGVVLTQNEFKKLNYDKIKYATQSGPIVLERGVINDYFDKDSKNFNIRSGVGKILGANSIVFVISEKPVTFYNFSRVFKELDCSDALYLDGAISEFYLPQMGIIDSKNRFGPIIGLVH